MDYHLKNIIKNSVGRSGMRAYHAARSHLTALAYRYPGREMTVIGVTGTNGKTTTANLIAAIFEAAGFRVALLSTIQFRICGKEEVNQLKMTVPDPGTLNHFLARAKAAKCQIFIVEATSHALDQQRFAGLKFDTGVLTNITHDHLDYHGTFARYVAAKRRLFAANLRLSVVNLDDPNGLEFATLPASEHLNYSLDLSQTHALRPVSVVYHADSTEMVVQLPDSNEQIEISTNLPGEYNLANILAAMAVGLGHGLPSARVAAAIKTVKNVPGRMERVEAGQPFSVIVDYAHTPDALEKLYEALQPLKSGHQIISVLGACGERDKTKRPVMGKIAGESAAFVVVTNEDPYTEDPEAIIDQVAAGVTNGNSHQIEDKTFWRVLDRRAAIHQALSLAKPGDIVTVTGKGAETAMAWPGRFEPWSDREVIKEELAKIGYV